MVRALWIMLCANIRFDHFDERNFSIGMQNPMKIVDSLWLWCLLWTSFVFFLFFFHFSSLLFFFILVPIIAVCKRFGFCHSATVLGWWMEKAHGNTSANAMELLQLAHGVCLLTRAPPCSTHTVISPIINQCAKKSRDFVCAVCTCAYEKKKQM